MGRKVLGESFEIADAFKAAFEAFVQTHWNGRLAHPFKWRYDGRGLHEKAVRRFIKLPAGSAGKFEVRILVKMLAPMTHLLADYCHEVPEAIWKQLAETAQLNDGAMADLIARDDRPQRKEKAGQVLTAFRHSIRQWAEQEREAKE